jgi:hypothetical protein
LANQAWQEDPVARSGLQSRIFDARAGRTEAGPEIGNEEKEDESEIDDLGGSPHGREELVAFVQWLCSGLISVNSVVKPQWRAALQLLGADLPNAYALVVREIHFPRIN